MKKYCAMQYSDGKFSAIEFFKKGGIFKISNYLSFKVIDRENSSIEIKARLFKEGIKASNTIFIAKSTLIKNEIKTFPKIPKRELSKVVEREAKRIFPDEEFFHDFIVLEEKEERRGRVVETLVSVAPQKYIWELFTFLRNIGKTPEIITTKIQSFIALKKIIEKDKETFGILNISPEKSTFVIFKENSNTIVERDIPVTGSDIFSDNDVDNIMVEISRTIQYFKQKHRGFDVSSIYIVGNISNLKEVINDLNEVSPYNFILCTGEKLSAKIEIPSGFEPVEFLSTFFDLLGAVFLIKEKDKINLLPSFYYEKEVFKKRRRNFILSFILLLAIIIPTTVIVEKFKSDAVNELKVQSKALQKLEMRKAEIESIKSRRRKIYEQMLSLGLEQLKIEEIVKFFNFLTLNSPSGIFLKEAEIKDNGKGLSIRIKGEALSDTPFLNNRIFNDFYLRIQAFPGIKSSKFSVEEGKKRALGEELISNIKSDIAGEKQNLEKKDFKILFTINLEIEPDER